MNPDDQALLAQIEFHRKALYQAIASKPELQGIATAVDGFTRNAIGLAYTHLTACAPGSMLRETQDGRNE